MYGLQVTLIARADAGGVHDALERLMDALHGMSDSDGRLDCTVGVGLLDVGDPNRGRVDVDLTVDAGSVTDAFGIGMTWLRTAAHAAGIATPGWEGVSATSGHVAFDEPEVKLGPVRELADT